MNSQMVWVGRHEGLLRDVARGCAYGNADCIAMGARILSAFIKQDSVLVPMPSHLGHAITMKYLCYSIVHLHGACKVEDCLGCVPHESMHTLKLRGEYPCEVEMFFHGTGYPHPENPESKIYIIDNCIGTGTTARAALKCLPNATVLAITKG